MTKLVILQNLGKDAGNLRLIYLQISRSLGLCSSSGLQPQFPEKRQDEANLVFIGGRQSPALTNIPQGTQRFMNQNADFLVSNLESWQWLTWYTWIINLAHIDANCVLHGSTCHFLFNKAADVQLLNIQLQEKGGGNIRHIYESRNSYISTDRCEHCD